MNVLMVWPRLPATFWSFKHVLNISSKKVAYPPLGLLTVAALLPREWNVRLVDLNVSAFQTEDLAWADYIMVSAMWVQKESVLDILHICGRYAKKVIAGGPLFNDAPDVIRSRINHLILNEAEGNLEELLRDLDHDCARKEYRRREFPDLSTTPVPRWELIDPRHYSVLTVQCSRGCPFHCEFCGISDIFGHRFRTKKPHQVLSELEILFALKWRGDVVFVDDNFAGRKDRAKQILREIIPWMKARDYPFKFSTQSSIDIADDDELLDLMKQAGFDGVFIGLETPSEKGLRECFKSQNYNRDLRASIKKLQATGLEVLGSYIVGFDSDDREIFEKQVEFIQNTGVVVAMVNLLNALPNTHLWRRLKLEGRLETDSPEIDTHKTVNFSPRMGKETLIKGYRAMLGILYDPGTYYRRIRVFLKHYRPYSRKTVQRPQARAFLKALFYLGILGNGRSQIYFWRMLFLSLWKYPAAFSKTITLMVLGRHFRKVVKNI